MNARVAGKQDNDSSHTAFAMAKVASQKLYVAIPRESRARPRKVKTVMGLLPGIPGIAKATAVTGTSRALIRNHTFAPSVASVKVEEGVPGNIDKDIRMGEDRLLGPAVASAPPRPTNAGLIVAIFSVLTLLNRMLLTIQYSFTSYPVFVTLYWTCVLAPAFYALHRWHTRTTPLTAAELSIPWYVWWIIGALSSIDSLIVGLSASHLKDFGSLQVLLSRGTIPISLAVTKIIFPQTAYARNQYAGATLVLLGLCVALLPGLLSSEAVPLSLLPWVGFYLSHCIPLAVGQIYSEYILKTYSCNEYYGKWMQSVPSIFITLILLVPSSAIDGVIPADLPDNLWRGLRCQFGVTPPGDESCMLAPVFIFIRHCCKVAT
jgi:hypothetical protein